MPNLIYIVLKAKAYILCPKYNCEEIKFSILGDRFTLWS